MNYCNDFSDFAAYTPQTTPVDNAHLVDFQPAINGHFLGEIIDVDIPIIPFDETRDLQFQVDSEASGPCWEATGIFVETPQEEFSHQGDSTAVPVPQLTIIPPTPDPGTGSKRTVRIKPSPLTEVGRERSVTFSEASPSGAHHQTLVRLSPARRFSRSASKTAEEGYFLRGSLRVTVHAAKNLVNTDVRFVSGKTDPYVRLWLDNQKGPRTTTVPNKLDPEWEESFCIYRSGHLRNIRFVVKDEDTIIPDFVGETDVSVSEFLEQELAASWRNLYSKKGMANGGQLKVTVRYIPADEGSRQVEVTPPKEAGLPPTPLRTGACEHRFPPIPLSHGTFYQRKNCWEEIREAIEGAKRFVFITGWSVDTAVALTRGEKPCILLDLLKRKAEEGVRVAMLLWDEVTSVNNKFLNALLPFTKGGLMNTHDEETKENTKHTPILCKLVKRKGKGIDRNSGAIGRTSIALSLYGKAAFFSHHQKSVIVDAPSATSQQRRAVAFVGGLDLTTGRYDTPDHPLFETLSTTHFGDFYQALGDFQPMIGPRQPWHDVHCKVEGPVARDVLRNFIQRWVKQCTARKGKFRVFKKWMQLLIAGTDQLAEDTFQDGWQAQMFRSIDAHSAHFVGLAHTKLVDRLLHKRKMVEHSILEAYVHHIHRAKSFIYIENQYFLGSCDSWEGFTEPIGLRHPVCRELAMTIVSKIRNHEPFRCYVVIPLHPEGPPESQAVQAILRWQALTLGMMYKEIAKAIQRYGPHDAHPTDYLVLFCLGKRGPVVNDASPAAGLVSDQRQLQMANNRRGMIYVHSKFMVVDDEYAIIGSANINERSLAGDRDTEIAVGVMQPQHTTAPDRPLPRGEVSGFRLSLWTEHTGGLLEEEFFAPHTVECARLLRRIGEDNWQAYVSAEVRTLPHGHLMLYPYDISVDGTVTPRVATFPDQPDTALVMGKDTMVPYLLTT
eukprot:TRINITY_DN7070_c0_g1_i2.p1 TRINITY_DN7070_c0_g1~~TRINITY_DN7070_c0_g1_i2.p1  ORF type:complete len:948 (-),score=105.62 TRINITY_DN7070_c0_g1_i2:18-2861(-)